MLVLFLRYSECCFYYFCLFLYVGAAVVAFTKSYSSASSSESQKYSSFDPKKVLILTKFSRLEFEKLRLPSLTSTEVEETLKKRGSDFRTLLYHHYIHKVWYLSTYKSVFII